MKDIEYLDEKFPKGKTKFRGEAMVLLSLARREGRFEFIKKIINKDFSCIKLNDLPKDILDIINERNIKISYVIDVETLIKNSK